MAIDYDSWKLASPYDYDEPTPADCGWVRKEDIPSAEDTQDFLKGIVEALYKTGNMSDLEHCVEELCGLHDVECEQNSPQVEQKNKNRLMHWCLGYQRATIELTNRRIYGKGRIT